MIAGIYRIWRTIWIFTAASFEASGFLATAVLTTMFVNLAAGVAAPIALRAVANAVMHQDRGAVTIGATVWLLGAGALQMISPLETILRANLRERTVLVLDKSLARLSSGIPTIAHFERPEFMREMELLTTQHGALADVESALLLYCHHACRLLLIVILISKVHPLLGLLPLSAFPALALTLFNRRKYYQLQDDLAESYRLAGYLQRVTTTNSSAKEVRIFGLGPELTERYRRVKRHIDHREDSRAIAGIALEATGWVLFSGGLVIGFSFVAQLVVNGQASVGDLILLLTLVSQISLTVGNIAGSSHWLMMALKSGDRYRWLLDYAAESDRDHAESLEDMPIVTRTGIIFDHVVFRYPGTTKPVLDDLTLTLPAGKIVAIVGENGAGKTTLVKLLARLYEPTEGKITVDGVDLRQLDLNEWRRQVSCCFEDFARFEFLARETVGIGDLPQIDSLPAVYASLEVAGAADIIEGLPKKIETQLGPSFDNGIDLSGGQWQKLALARTMMRGAPLLMALDEPTAALDALAEQQLFERYAAAARRVSKTNGGITLLVTHRFSTVAIADVIVVLADGKVVEYGSHSELVKAGHLYAQLYAMQAEGYQA